MSFAELHEKADGFTIPELLTVLGVACLLLLGSVLLLRPHTYAAERRNAQRWVGISELVDVLGEYKTVTGHFPAAITPTTRPIGSVTGEVDICKAVVPTFADNLPFDPSVGVEGVSDASIQVKNCATTGVTYTTGYSVATTADGQLTVAADNAELGAHISLTRRF